MPVQDVPHSLEQTTGSEVPVGQAEFWHARKDRRHNVVHQNGLEEDVVSGHTKDARRLLNYDL